MNSGAVKPFPQINYFSHDFKEPETISECQDRLFELQQNLHKINQQINDPHRMEKLDISNEEYQMWKHKAIHARNAKRMQQKILNQWLQSQKVKRALDAISGSNPVAIIEKLVEIITFLKNKHNFELTDEMSDIISLANNIVSNDPIGR
ncbi:hypothetical protein EBS67_00515 [bacterium]|nr:hypothetical protein [bacterium]NBT60753.1 hypothetical protein [Planctomycetia bacterium]